MKISQVLAALATCLLLTGCSSPETDAENEVAVTQPTSVAAVSVPTPVAMAPLSTPIPVQPISPPTSKIEDAPPPAANNRFIARDEVIRVENALNQAQTSYEFSNLEFDVREKQQRMVKAEAGLGQADSPEKNAIRSAIVMYDRLAAAIRYAQSPSPLMRRSAVTQIKLAYQEADNVQRNFDSTNYGQRSQ